MSCVRIRRLRATAFRAFLSLDVEFPERGKILIRGKNTGTGGSSGSGKSSVVLALNYLFGTCPYPATELQSWLTDEPMLVAGELDTPKGTVTIERGAGRPLHINGKKVPESELEAILGMDSDMLKALTYRPQRTFGLFLNKTDSEKKEFLSALLGLDAIEKAVSDAQERAKTFSNVKVSLDAELQAAESLLAEKEMWYSVTYEDPKLVQNEIDELLTRRVNIIERIGRDAKECDALEADAKAALQGISRDRENALKQIETELAAARELREPFVEGDTAEMDKLATTAATIGTRIFKLRKDDTDKERALLDQEKKLLVQESEAKSYKRELEELEVKLEANQKEIASVEAAKCPTCSQTWNNNARYLDQLQDRVYKIGERKKYIGPIVSNLSMIQSEINRLRQHIACYTPNPLIGKLEDAKRNVEAELATIREARKNARALYDAKIKAEEAEYARRLEEKRGFYAKLVVETSRNAEVELARAKKVQGEVDYRQVENDLANARLRLQGIEQRNKEKDAEQTRRDKLYGERTKKVVALRKEQEDLETKMKAELDFVGACGREGFLGLIFDEVLQEISQETNKILASIPNVAHVTLSFKSEAENKKGTVKKSITPVLSLGGAQRSIGSALSGGMTQAVELAVDLAVGEVISRRTGSVPGWLILDEAFTGLGPHEMEACMAVLNQVAEHRLVMVIDHASEFGELFNRFIDVEHSNGISTLKESTDA